MHLQPATLLQGRYRVQGLLAQGGMGAVYRAVDERLGNTVALKQTLVSDPQLREAFEREARLLAGLQHPALPVVSDHFSEGGGQFLVMQFIPGDDLAALQQRRGGPFALAQVLAWADRLLDALDYLHGRQPPVIHRDIKPQNLKLSERGELILLDFGLAKGEPAGGGRSVFGYTPQYAPLEQIQGTGTDARSDLYAVGATIYQLLTGAIPPDVLSRAGALAGGQPDPLPPARDLAPAVPAAVSDLLARAMAIRPEDRPASAAALRAALHQAAAQPGSAGLPTLALARETIAQDPAPGAEPRGRPAPLLRAGGALLAALAVLALGVFLLAGRLAPEAGDGALSGGGGGEIVIDTPDAAGLGASRDAPLPQSAFARVGRWEVRVLEFQRGERALRTLAQANSNNRRPADGLEYVLVRFEITLNGLGPAESFERGDLGLVGEYGVLFNAFAAVPPEPVLGDAQTGAGGRAEGWAAFLAGADDQNLILVFEPLLGDAEPVYMALTEGARLGPDLALAAIDPTDVGASLRAPAALGELATTEDWQITVEEVIRGEPAYALLLEANQFNDPPPAGMEYIVSRVRVRSIADRDQATLIFDSYFTTVSGAGEEVGQGSVVEPDPSLQAELFPGGEWVGYMAHTVPIGDAGALLVFKATSSLYDPEGFNTRFFALE